MKVGTAIVSRRQTAAYDATMRLHVGLIGCGPWGGNILRDLRSLGLEVSVVARHDSSAERAANGGADRVVRDTGELPDVDGIVIATEATNHFDAISAVLERGVPIYVEKPVTTDLSNAHQLLAQAPDRIFAMHKWRYHPAIDRMRDLINAGDLGEPTSLRTTRHQWGSGHTDIDCTWTLLPHDLSIALHLFGDLPEIVHAWGTSEGPEVESLGAILGERPWVRIDVSVRSAERRRSFTVEGTGGTATVSDRNYNAVTIRTASSDEPTEIAVPATMPLLAELTAFVEHLRGGPPPMSSLAEAVSVIERCEALRRLAAD